jgi:hypothetical protein
MPGTYCEVHDEPVPTNTMAWRTHEGIALGPTANLQGIVKFFCINTGRVLKRRSFTKMPMPDRVIKRVEAIGRREKQGRNFRFLNRRGEPYEWTDEVPEDDPDFQGLLEESEETAVYPDISAELPGVTLEIEEGDYQAMTDDSKPDFRVLADVALQNAGIDADNVLRQARAAEGDVAADNIARGPAIVEAEADKIVYELTFDLPDAGLPPPDAALHVPLGDDRNDALVPAMVPQDAPDD